MIGNLFRAVASLVPSMRAIQQTADIVADLGNAYQTTAALANQFYSATIRSNLELQGIVRQSSVIIAAQTQLFDAVGNNVTGFDAKLSAITPRVKGIQKEIEIATRDIVGATDTQTNAILGQVINQFSVLQGQTKEFADEMAAIPTLVAGITSAMNTFQIPEFQIPQEVRSLLQGDLNNPDSQLARQLQSTGLTKEAFEQARAQGTLIDLLIEKTNAFRQANSSASDSIVNSFSIIQDITSQTFRIMGEDPTEGLRQGLTNITALFKDGELEKKINNIAQAFGGPIGEAISSSMALATNSFRQFAESLGEGKIEAFAENIGQFIGDTISIVGQLGTAVVITVGTIVNRLSEAWDRLEAFTKILTLDFSFKGKVEPIPDELQTSVEQEIEDFNKDLNQKGLLKRVYDIVVGLNPVYQIRKAIVQGSDIGEIKKSADSVIKTFESEIERSKPQIDFMMDLAPKIAAVDTTSIDNFKANGLAPIQDEITRLESNIDFSKLSEKASNEVRSTLDSISSSADFGAAQTKISDLMRRAQMGTDAELDKYSGYSDILRSQIAALKSQRDELTTIAKEGGITDEIASKISAVNALYEQQVEIQGRLAEASNPAILAKQKEIKEAQLLGDSTAKLTKELKNLQIQARESNGAEIGFASSVKIGSALIKTYNDLSSAIDSYNGKLDATPEKAKQDFEELLKTVEAAEKVGSVGFTGLKNLMVSAIKDQYLAIENRQQALEKYNQLVETEAKLQNQGLEIQEKSLELTVQRGLTTKEDSSIQSNNIEKSKNLVEILKIQQQLASQKALEEAGSTEELDAQIAKQQSLLLTATETEKVSIRNQIAKLTEQKTQLEIGSAKRQELELTLENLEINGQLLSAKNSQLDIDKKLSEVAQQKEEDSSKLAILQANREKEIAELRQNGLLDSDISLEKAEAELEAQSSKIDLIREELQAKQQILEGANNIPLEQKLSLQNDINNLLAEETNAQASLLNSRLDYEEQLRNVLIEKQRIILDTANAEADANKQLEESFYKIEEALLNVDKAQQDLLSSSIAIQQGLNQNKIVEYDIRLAGVDRINDLTSKFEEGNYALNAAISDSINWIQDNLNITNTGLAEQLRIIDEKAALEQANADITYQFKLEELRLESEINNLQLEGDNAQLESQKLQLKLKQEELQLEKDIIQAKADNGEISQEDADKRIEATEKIQVANDNLIESLDIQVDSNNKMIDSSESILLNRSNLLGIEKETEDTTRKTATNYEKADRTIDLMKSKSSKSRGGGGGSGDSGGNDSGGNDSDSNKNKPSPKSKRYYSIGGVRFKSYNEAKESGLIDPTFTNTKADKEFADIRAKKFGVNSVSSSQYRAENGGDGSFGGADYSGVEEYRNKKLEEQRLVKENAKIEKEKAKDVAAAKKAQDKELKDEQERSEANLRISRKNSADQASSQSKNRIAEVNSESNAQVSGANTASSAIQRTTQNYNAAASAARGIADAINAIPSNKTVTIKTINTNSNSVGGGTINTRASSLGDFGGAPSSLGASALGGLGGASSSLGASNRNNSSSKNDIDYVLGLGGSKSKNSIANQLSNGTGSFSFSDGKGGKITTFGGLREHGGGVEVGKSYIVGEAGPELFVPTSTGHVISNEDTKKAAKNFGGNLAGGSMTRANNSGFTRGAATISTNGLGAAKRYTGDKYGMKTYTDALKAAAPTTPRSLMGSSGGSGSSSLSLNKEDTKKFSSIRSIGSPGPTNNPINNNYTGSPQDNFKYQDGVSNTSPNPNLALPFGSQNYPFLRGTSYTGAITDPTEKMLKVLEGTNFKDLYAKNAEQILKNRANGIRVDALDENGDIPFYLTKEFSTQLSSSWNEAVANLEKSASVAGLKIEESFSTEDLTNQLAALLRSPEQNKETRAQIERISGQLGEQLRNTEEQVSLLDALKQGSFQGGGYKQSTNTSTFLDSKTGQLIIGGTRPDLNKLSQLPFLSASPSLPQINSNSPSAQLQPQQPQIIQQTVEKIKAQLLAIKPVSGSNTTIINNYPDLAGSVSSQLRSAAL